jgi:hypothetical protein
VPVKGISQARQLHRVRLLEKFAETFTRQTFVSLGFILEVLVMELRKIVVLSICLCLLAGGSVLAFHPTTSCDRCHLVHNAAELDGMPLWSGLGIAADTAFILYESDSLDAIPGNPQGSTLLCLGCHDNSTSNGHYPEINPSGDPCEPGIAGDLSGTHPIEFVFNSGLATDDGELHDPLVSDSHVIGGKGTITEDLLAAVTERVNCISCHEIHANGLHGLTDAEAGDLGLPYNGDGWDMPHLANVPGIEFKVGYGADATDPDMYSLRYGALCMVCHIK